MIKSSVFGFIILNEFYFILVIHCQTGLFASSRSVTEFAGKCAPNPTQPLPPLIFSDCQVPPGSAFARNARILTTSESIEEYGYGYQTFNITTNDGYVLQVFRVISRNESRPVKNTPVFLNHGIFGSSDHWLYQYGNQNLAIKLAEAGYDVWIGNGRGSPYSKNHITFDSENINFWNFSFHEMALYDVPAVIDSILSESRQSQLFYVGHSAGTTQYMVALSALPELNDKITAGFLLAPAGEIGHMNNPIRYLVPLEDHYMIINTIFNGRIDVNSRLLERNFIFGNLCSPTAARCGACIGAFASLGYNPTQINTTLIPQIVGTFAGEASVRTLVHFAQMIRECRFQEFDFGVTSNLKIYGSKTPPLYKLEQIRVPTFFYHGNGDNLVQSNDVYQLASKFSPGVIQVIERVNDVLFNHGDFVSARNASNLLYDKILSEMDRLGE